MISWQSIKKNCGRGCDCHDTTELRKFPHFQSRNNKVAPIVTGSTLERDTEVSEVDGKNTHVPLSIFCVVTKDDQRLFVAVVQTTTFLCSTESDMAVLESRVGERPAEATTQAKTD